MAMQGGSSVEGRGRGRPERVDDKAATPPPLSHALPSILAKARDSFERTAFRVTVRGTPRRNHVTTNSPLNLEIKFVIPDFRYIEFSLYCYRRWPGIQSNHVARKISSPRCDLSFLRRSRARILAREYWFPSREKPFYRKDSSVPRSFCTPSLLASGLRPGNACSFANRS